MGSVFLLSWFLPLIAVECGRRCCGHGKTVVGVLVPGVDDLLRDLLRVELRAAKARYGRLSGSPDRRIAGSPDRRIGRQGRA
ncbi:hypothetical protein OG204_04790 [Streptomyces sp. NBC_01387]|uniref:hypothetical protein n=1 Tax=unclassified Streptomyces TaxID=2593676 RepID=UPI002250860F|nr:MULTISPECIES: hypothetical protein [unclassified Streptomyces]MCX4552398.1 hypothetical protein [Streptomyces sp. NBC_01500]WSC23752.1 hypothetical protein OIE60_31060 [Streptomyces sp. NBC_01766]